VPSNNFTFPDKADLATFYDNNAQSLYATFMKGLSQIQCEAGPTAQYSLARTCADCEKAYKSWLCSVTIPRCEDFSATDSWLQPRAVFSQFPDNSTLPESVTAQYPNSSAFNSSRNPLIDSNVTSGPYKEILPCQDVCYNLVQSCPAALGFACPRPGWYGFSTSYGIRSEEDNDGQITCNYPGSAHFFSDASRVQSRWVSIEVSAFVVVATIAVMYLS
jgi:calcium channel MID1